MQGWLDQYQEESMMPHIYTSLQGYPGRWVHMLEDSRNLTVPELLACMDCAFGDVHDYDTMIRSLYEIRQKDSESVEEYMLRIHEAFAVICHAYLDQISDQGKNLMRDRFYHSLSPSLRFAMAELPEREQVNMSFDTLYMLTKKMEACQPSLSHEDRSFTLMLTEISIGDTPCQQNGLPPLKMKNCSHLIPRFET